ncbi:hypothetical protein T01_503 [Trichinella spiralis]|uniref:Uncharacterized protein n=1 Tax=Trichinella spiralis TaxID=6334 RepID=A0A0V1C465_TRISP|nr:hypothetical protein T01_503 [Trichinella spiralis]
MDDTLLFASFNNLLSPVTDVLLNSDMSSKKAGLQASNIVNLMAKKQELALALVLENYHN